MAQQPLVYLHAYRHSADIDLHPTKDHKEFARLSILCVAKATTALEKELPEYTEKHRHQLTDIFKSLASTDESIRRVLEPGWQDPSSVDALVLARLQLEGLYAVVLMLDHSKYIDQYTKDHWRKLYVEYLLIREETSELPRFGDFLASRHKELIHLAQYFGVTQGQIRTVEHEELGHPLPPGANEEPIRKFPTPGSVKRLVVEDKRRMLERLHLKYLDLCSFAHGLGKANMYKIMFDKRSPQGRWLSDSQREERFQFEVSGDSYITSFLSIAQATAELTALYPNDMDLIAAASNAWGQLSDASLLTRAVWDLRTKSLLRVI